MNISNRLEKLERSRNGNGNYQPEECQHPPGAFKVHQDYPCLWRETKEGELQSPYRWTKHILARISDHRLVIKGHCNKCGYESYLWDVTHTTEDQMDRLMELFFEGDREAHGVYATWLVENGYLDFVPWPPTQELRHQVATKGAFNEYQR